MQLLDEKRNQMVERQIAGRGVRDKHVLEAMRKVPRERFIEGRLREFAYEDTPLPIEQAQTISQPYIVALMIEAAEVKPGDHVLEIGAGSGYASAVLGQIADQVVGVEWHKSLADTAQSRMTALGYRNVRIYHGDGTKGWPEHAPYDAIIVSAGGPSVPHTLLEQLRIGGRLILPVGEEPRSQDLLLIKRTATHQYDRQSLGQVQFVPLVGSEGWAIDGTATPEHRAPEPLRLKSPDREQLSTLIGVHGEPFNDLEDADLDPLLARIGDAKVVLIGESTHGTSEFYRMRARITRELIEQKGFNIVAIEADWPDASAIDRHVRGIEQSPLRGSPFTRFPSWMWRNEETRAFVDWLADYNHGVARSSHKVSVHGLDLYSLNNSIGAVLDYLDRVDPETAATARVRYGCFSPWETDPATYGRAVVAGELAGCESAAISILNGLFAQRMKYIQQDGDAFFDATRNAVVIREAERYYREMYYGSRESWNLRDCHMFDTLQAVLKHRGKDAKAVVWAHNSHVGDARATEMGTRGELNIGQLAREEYGERCYRIGMGTDHGTVVAAHNWDDPMQIMTVRPSHADSYEQLCHRSGVKQFLLPLRRWHNKEVNEALRAPHLQRAIGVIYRPATEMLSHYFQAVLPAQFDEYIWFDQTHALEAIRTEEVAGVPETYPFGL